MLLVGNLSAELGYCVIPYPSEEPLAGLASELGSPVPARPGDPLTSTLVPMTAADSHPRSLSRAYGTGSFPFHTDAAHHRNPPSLVLLRACSGNASEIPTQLLPFAALVFSQDERDVLRTALFAISGGPRSRFYRTILDRGGIRFDPGCMSPVDHRARLAVDLLQGAIRDAGSVGRVAPTVDEVLVIDNQACLHARPPVPETEIGRALERVMVRTNES